MPRFRFNLQRVLEIRRHKEELLTNELANLQRKQIHEESILWELKAKHIEQLDEIRKRQSTQNLSSEEMLWYYLYLERLNNDIKRQKAVLLELKKKVDDVKERLIEASQKRRILERLYERKFREWKVEEERREEAFLDEIGLSMYTRRINQLTIREEEKND